MSTTPAKDPEDAEPPRPAGPEVVVGKGRPTPKRREAERDRRQRVVAPRDRREAARLNRDRNRAERLKMRQAMVTGDERHLPPRDRGPVRRYVRDFIDARRSVAEYFLYIALTVFVITLVPSPTLRLIGGWVWLVMLPLLVVDSFLLSRRLKRALRERFPDAEATRATKGAIAYGLMRSLQMRRLRLPKPQVRPGAQI